MKTTVDKFLQGRDYRFIPFHYDPELYPEEYAFRLCWEYSDPNLALVELWIAEFAFEEGLTYDYVCRRLADEYLRLKKKESRKD